MGAIDRVLNAFILMDDPQTNDAIAELATLRALLREARAVIAGVQVSDLDRGLVDYFAGQYDVAAAAFDRYIAANPGNDGTPHYYRALALRELGNHQQAVDEFTAFIAGYPSHARWADAWDEKAYTQWVNLGLYEDAAATLLEYVRIAPGSAQAPDELVNAGVHELGFDTTHWYLADEFDELMHNIDAALAESERE